MKKVYIFDPTKKDVLAKYRGGGRFLKLLKENLKDEAKFITNFKKVKKESILIIPSFNPYQPPTLRKKIAQKQILVIYDVIPLKYQKYFPAGLRGKLNLFLNQLTLGLYDKIITISNQSKKDIVQYLKVAEEKIEVVYPTVSEIFAKSKVKTRKSKVQLKSKKFPESLPNSYCLYVGDVNWNKNLVNLARAIKTINVSCVFIGRPFSEVITKRGVTRLEGAKRPKDPIGNKRISRFACNDRKAEILSHPWLTEFRKFLEEIEDDKRFVFLGYLEDKDLLKLYQQARLNVLVSRDEGFGLSFIEAASQGCPSVLSDIEVFKETAADAAFFADMENPYAIANKIGEIYFNDQLRSNLGKKAKKRASFFSANKFRTDFLKTVV